jgi:hypothetical protein
MYAFFGMNYLMYTNDDPSPFILQNCFSSRKKMIVRREVGALLLVPLLTSSLPNNVRIGEYTPKSKVLFLFL